MGLYVLLVCILLVILLSVINQWKLLLLLALISAASATVLLWYSTLHETGHGDMAEKEIESVHILYGIEKKGLLKDLEFQETLRKKHRIVIKGTKLASLRLPERELQGTDGLWPSSGWATARFDQQHPDLQHKTHMVFHTPLVLYSWTAVTDALIKKGVVKKRENLYILDDMKQILEMGKQTWGSIRLPHQRGLITIQSADPLKDNAGHLMASLTALMLNGGKRIETGEIESHLPAIQMIYKRMGDPETSADVLFNTYIKQGQGVFPLISACENQVIEFYQSHPSYQEKMRRLVRVLIPEPTVLSEHPFIALTEKGEMLLNALQDPDIRKLAWEKYGFRSDAQEMNDLGGLRAIGIPDQIGPVVPLPSPEVMDRIVAVSSKL